MDVNLYTINAPTLRGNVDNTHVSKYSAEYLGVTDTMARLTRKIAKMNVGATTPLN